mmetsp:Transcript_4704/g.10144  ORF Transcript_4704/g.10144 Transcript_4704/m.10144 type:complete len:295 (+) Transcript_4704:165-1049(+)
MRVVGAATLLAATGLPLVAEGFVTHGFVTSTPRAANPPRRMRVSALLPISVKEVTTQDELEAASQFFVGAFWGSSTPTGELGDSESAQLERDQLRDWNRRYGSEGGGSGSEAALLVAKEGRRIVGCVSVSVGSYSRILDGRIGGGGGGGGGSFDPRSARTAAAAPSSSAKGSKGALPDLNRVRSEDVPLVANLAVAKRARKKGIGARLAREAERLAEGYGYPEIVLLVEESNAPAVKLYRKLGYKELWRVGNAPKIDVTTGNVRTVRTTNVAMAKPLGKTSPLLGLGRALGLPV